MATARNVLLWGHSFVNSAWTREIDGRRWWVVIGLHDTVETVIDTDKRRLGDSIVTSGGLYDRVERVNRELMAAEGQPPGNARKPTAG